MLADSGYSSRTNRPTCVDAASRKGEEAPIQATQRAHGTHERRHNSFNRLQRCYQRRQVVAEAFLDLADTIITLRALIRRPGSPTTGRPDPQIDHDSPAYPRDLSVRVFGGSPVSSSGAGP